MQLVYRACMVLPEMLVEAFDGDEDLLAWVRTLRGSWQKDISAWVMEPKSEEARKRRCEHTAERLLQTMEAEQQLPPMLAQRLHRAPHALAGWERLSVSRRRELLLAVFGARGEETRERHITKMIESCQARAAETDSRSTPRT